LALFHGWPGSFLEFLPMLDLLKSKYDPSTLPYHVIVPSTPGYAWSSPPPLDRDFDCGDISRLMNILLTSIGCTGYVSQGGDIGSKLARICAVEYPECRGVHTNFCHMLEPEGFSGKLSERDQAGLKRSEDFMEFGSAYAREHATRPATIGFVMASSPVAQLAWIGEKFLAWTDQDLPIETVLEDLTLYWLTKTFPNSVYMYRQDDKRVSPAS
jgi:microsomal epoxide hydrolase